MTHSYNRKALAGVYAYKIRILCARIDIIEYSIVQYNLINVYVIKNTSDHIGCIPG